MSADLTLTTNDGIAFSTTENVLIDYFGMLSRTLTPDENNRHLEKCWKADPRTTLAIIFNSRDRKNGKKEKKISNDAMLWLRLNKPKTYKKNIMTYVNKYGCWKDLTYIANRLDNNDSTYELGLFAQQLQTDIAMLLDNENGSVSLCAKWAPSENDSNDKKKHFAKKIAGMIFSRNEASKMKKYRKDILTPLRNRINIIESLMCSNDWTSIRYDAVSGVASKRYLNAFNKHDKERYEKYLADVRSGKKEIKTTGILPHELIKYYIDNPSAPCETIELQWQAIVDNIKQSGVLCNTLAVVDVSGSMYGASNGDIPVQVAIAIGILTALCCEGQFHRKMISFSAVPVLITLKGKTLFECYQEVIKIPQGLNTNFIAVADTIVDYALTFSVPDDKMPKKLIALTDMQFDRAASDNSDLNTAYQIMSKVFSDAKYTAPKFIFWNVNSDNSATFPIKSNDDGTAIVSGFSEQLLKIIMQYEEFNSELMLQTIVKPYLDDVMIDESEL